jgi:hypothetical protein
MDTTGSSKEDVAFDPFFDESDEGVDYAVSHAMRIRVSPTSRVKHTHFRNDWKRGITPRQR